MMMSFPSCKGCGWCCEYNVHQIKKNDPRGTLWLEQSLEFYRARSVEEIEADDVHVFYLRQPCPHYKEGFGCEIYETRPVICRKFPNSWHEWMEDKCAVMKDKYKGV